VALPCDDGPDNNEAHRLPVGLKPSDGCYLDADVADALSRLAAKDEEIEMLGLELEVNRTDDERRADRLDALEQRLARQEARLNEYMGGVETVCRYLADTVARLRAMS